MTNNYKYKVVLGKIPSETVRLIAAVMLDNSEKWDVKVNTDNRFLWDSIVCTVNGVAGLPDNFWFPALRLQAIREQRLSLNPTRVLPLPIGVQDAEVIDRDWGHVRIRGNRVF